MKVTTHSKAEFSTALAHLTARNDLYFAEFVQVSSVLARFWSDFLTVSELSIIQFLVGRTLAFRKRAELISRSHFMEGVVSSDGLRICSGVGVAYSTLRIALEGLVQKEIVEVHAFTDGRKETIPRIYEVKTAKILEGRDTEEVLNMLRRAYKTGVRGPESSENRCAEIQHTVCRNSAHLKEIHSISNTSSYEDVPSPSATGRKREFLVDPKKKTRSANVCAEAPATTAKERAAQILGKARDKRAKRASNTSVPTKRWDVPTLQALLDTARESANVQTARVVVTTKPIGVLHKRMKEAQVENVLDFFTWALRNWNTVANAHRRSTAKKAQTTKSAAQQEMKLVPNFNDLSYRFPYLLAFYNDRAYTEKQQAAEREQAIANDRAQRQAATAASNARRANVRRLDEEREAARRKQDAEFERRRHVRRSLPDDDDDLPEYEAPVWGGQ